jgi:hypothetical protein
VAKRKPSDKDILATARERYRLAEEAEREIRREAKIDLEFAAGNQWDTDDQNRRNAACGRAAAVLSERAAALEELTQRR